MARFGSLRPSLHAAARRLSARLWLLIFPIALPAIRPFYIEGLTRSFDGGLHLLRIGLLDRYVRSGVFFLRWAPELLLGHGYPCSTTTPPRRLLRRRGAHLLGVSPYHAFIAVMAAFVIAARHEACTLALDIFGRRHSLAALVAAVAYLHSPYLLTNVYIRGAISRNRSPALALDISRRPPPFQNDRPPVQRLCACASLGPARHHAHHHAAHAAGLPVALHAGSLASKLGICTCAAMVPAIALLAAMGVSAFSGCPSSANGTTWPKPPTTSRALFGSPPACGHGTTSWTPG